MTPQPKELTITIKPDGEIKTDASKMPGSEAQILAELGELAELLSGDPAALVVEAHKHGVQHVHVHAGSATVHAH